MTARVNRQWRLVRRPIGMVAPSDFEYREEPVPALSDGGVLVRTLYVSFDPAMRAFLHDRPSYIPPQPMGEVMRAGAIGQVVESRSEVQGGRPGDGWLRLAELRSLRRRAAGCGKDPGDHPLPKYLGVLGGTGLTAQLGCSKWAKSTQAKPSWSLVRPERPVRPPFRLPNSRMSDRRHRRRRREVPLCDH